MFESEGRGGENQRMRVKEGESTRVCDTAFSFVPLFCFCFCFFDSVGREKKTNQNHQRQERQERREREEDATRVDCVETFVIMDQRCHMYRE